MVIFDEIDRIFKLKQFVPTDSINIKDAVLMRDISINTKSINFNRLLPKDVSYCFMLTHELNEKLNRKVSSDMTSQLP